MKKKFTRVMTMHYVKLVYRSLLFLAVLIFWIYCKVNHLGGMLDRVEEKVPFLLGLVWVIFMIEMVLRFFPSKFESPGCQKQFARNYQPTGKTNPIIHDDHAGFIVALVWILFNMAIGALYQTGLISADVMLLVALAYSVCDIICILFFCPFQTWFLKNKCCSACRIYNWDFAMMFTPFFFVPKVYTWTLLAASIALLLRWEITLWKYPERFSENTNAYLKCSNCSEKLCVHKKQLKTLWDDLEVHADMRMKEILTGIKTKAGDVKKAKFATKQKAKVRLEADKKKKAEARAEKKNK